MESNPDLGKLCYKHGGSALCYKHGGSSLIFKSEPSAGDITVAIVSDQDRVGPIKSCGNIHNVVITPNAQFTQGSGTITSGGQGSKLTFTISVTQAPATVTINCTTASQGCAYPDENPPMNFSVTATQNRVQAQQTTKSVSNVATGSFSVSVQIDQNKKITGLN